MSQSRELSKEERILKVMRAVLTKIIRETATPPNLKHPLSNECVEDMRQCLFLISARETELKQDHGDATAGRPRYADEPRPQGPVAIPVDQISRKPKDSE